MFWVEAKNLGRCPTEVFYIPSLYISLDGCFKLFQLGADNTKIKPKKDSKPIEYPKPDGVLTFDILTSVSLTGTNHEENQPPHLTLLNDNVPTEVNLQVYDGPEGRYCPAGKFRLKPVLMMFLISKTFLPDVSTF